MKKLNLIWWGLVAGSFLVLVGIGTAQSSEMTFDQPIAQANIVQ